MKKTNSNQKYSRKRSMKNSCKRTNLDQDETMSAAAAPTSGGTAAAVLNNLQGHLHFDVVSSSSDYPCDVTHNTQSISNLVSRKRKRDYDNDNNTNNSNEIILKQRKIFTPKMFKSWKLVCKKCNLR